MYNEEIVRILTNFKIQKYRYNILEFFKYVVLADMCNLVSREWLHETLGSERINYQPPTVVSSGNFVKLNRVICLLS
ncbi:hypothetical protein Avbf_05914 [Armadillidium vulgare]|nr:hypothetical protein Avbf_05914 [Armadillidium vulgare]